MKVFQGKIREDGGRLGVHDLKRLKSRYKEEYFSMVKEEEEQLGDRF